MMNKDELEKQLKKITELLESEKKTNAFLNKEQKKYVKMAEEANSELAPYKQMVTRLSDELERLKLVKK